MKSYTRVLISLAVMAPLMFGSAAVAHGETATQTNESKPTAATAVDTTPAKVTERVAARKAALKTKLAAAEETRLKGKCKASQTVVMGLNKRLDNVAVNHTKHYQEVSEKLAGLITRVGDQGGDITKLKQAKDAYDAKVVAYKTQLGTYQQALADVQAMDCTVDAAGFKASLETARSTRAELAKSAADIRTYVQQNIKPVLVELRTQLSKQSTTQGSNQ